MTTLKNKVALIAGSALTPSARAAGRESMGQHGPRLQRAARGRRRVERRHRDVGRLLRAPSPPRGSPYPPTMGLPCGLRGATLTWCFVERFAIVGSPEHCIERLLQLHALGINRFVVVGPGTQQERQQHGALLQVGN